MATAIVGDVVERALAAIPWSKRQIGDHEARLLARLAAACDGGAILEIGTALGFSAAVMALAAPNATITTLNPKPGEFEQAVENLADFGNVEVVQAHSADYLKGYEGPLLDMVFVDGDHRREGVLADAEWWRWLKRGGMLLFHDYTLAGKRRTPEVYEAVNEWKEKMGLIADLEDYSPDDGAGMAGFYKRAGG
jgi:predicted O-methyltransferase YrrM